MFKDMTSCAHTHLHKPIYPLKHALVRSAAFPTLQMLSLAGFGDAMMPTRRSIHEYRLGAAAASDPPTVSRRGTRRL